MSNTKVKCRYCGKLIDRSTAYSVPHGKRNWYYCTEEHSLMKTDREIMYEELQEIIGVTTHTIFFQEFDKIAKVHGYKKVISYIKENKDYLMLIMNKDFSSEYGKIRYFSAIFKNNLGDFIEPKEEIKKEIVIDTPIFVNKSNRKRKKSMNSLMKEIMNE